MIHVKVSERVEAGAAAVWDLVSDFGGVKRYTPDLASCELSGEGVGAVRTLTLPGGVELQERLEALDDSGRRLQYSILSGPIPVQDYLATVEVHEDGDACTVDWSSQFTTGMEEAQAVAMMEGVYRGGLAGMRKALGV